MDNVIAVVAFLFFLGLLIWLFRRPPTSSRPPARHVEDMIGGIDMIGGLTNHPQVRLSISCKPLDDDDPEGLWRVSCYNPDTKEELDSNIVSAEHAIKESFDMMVRNMERYEP